MGSGMLRRLGMKDFRGFGRAEVRLDERVNVIVAPNGAGKTTVRAALEYLATGKSTDFSGGRRDDDGDLVRVGARKALLEGEIEGIGLARRTVPNALAVEGWDKAPTKALQARLLEAIGGASEDLLRACLNAEAFLLGGPEERRKLLLAVLGAGATWQEIAASLGERAREILDEVLEAQPGLDEKAVSRIAYDRRTGINRKIEDARRRAEAPPPTEPAPASTPGTEQVPDLTGEEIRPEDAERRITEIEEETRALRARRDAALEASVRRQDDERERARLTEEARKAGEEMARAQQAKERHEKLGEPEVERARAAAREAAEAEGAAAGRLAEAIGARGRLDEGGEEGSCPILGRACAEIGPERLAELRARADVAVSEANSMKKAAEARSHAMEKALEETRQRADGLKEARERFDAAAAAHRKALEARARLKDANGAGGPTETTAALDAELAEKEREVAGLRRSAVAAREREARAEEGARRAAREAEDAARRAAEAEMDREAAEGEAKTLEGTKAALEEIMEALGPNGVRARKVDAELRSLEAEAEAPFGGFLSLGLRLDEEGLHVRVKVRDDAEVPARCASGSASYLGSLGLLYALAVRGRVPWIAIDGFETLDAGRKREALRALGRMDLVGTILVLAVRGEREPRDPGVPGFAFWEIRDGQIVRSLRD